MPHYEEELVMKRFKKLVVLSLFSILLISCEVFFTTSWFSAAADYSDISTSEAISSGDTAVMQQVYDRLVEEAASATGEEASALYIQAADLALGISGMSDPSALMSLMESTSGEGGDMFSLFSSSDFNTDALEDVSVMVANAEAASPGSVDPDLWLLSAAGNYAAVVNDAEDVGQSVEDFLGSDPLMNDDVKGSVQALVNAMDILPADLASQLTDNQADLIADGIVFP